MPNMTARPSPHEAGPRPGDRWRQALLDSAVPQEVLDRAPEPEGSLEPERFRWSPEEDAKHPIRPSRRRALEALPAGGSVLDVGAGGGASSLGLVPRPGLIVGVDPLAGMLESFEASARDACVAVKAVLGTWPEAAEVLEPADIAVCHHVLYRFAEIEDFVTALTVRARHRVVVELSSRPPLDGLNPLWRSLHGIERSGWPVADEAQAVLVAMGLAVEREDIVLAPRTQEVTPASVAFARRRLFVGPEHDPAIEEFLRARKAQEQRVAALWWPGAAV